MAKQVLITGATSGIGREAAFQMARQGASLILPVRDLAKGSAVATEIAHASGGEAPWVIDSSTQAFTGT